MTDEINKWTCAHCGYSAHGKFEGDICPDCGLTYWTCGECGFTFMASKLQNVCSECGAKESFIKYHLLHPGMWRAWAY